MTTASSIVHLLHGYRWPVGVEADLQRAISEVLDARGYEVCPEYDLGAGLGRIDFYLPTLRTGLEVKVKGSPSDVTRQLLRYAQSREIDTLILVTGRARLGVLPPMLGGKPLHVAAIWRGLL